MFKSYLKTAVRFLWRQRAYTVINVLGLAVGLACSFFILLWVQDELRHDRFHEQGDHLYRVMRNAYYGEGQLFTWPAIPKPLAQELDASYPEVERVALSTWPEDLVIARGDQAFREQGRHVGPAWFEMFSFPLLLGDPATALQNPEAIVISETLAERYFGTDWRTQGDVLGQTLRVDGRYEATVTGVFEALPAYSSLQFDFVLPIDEFVRNNAWVEEWGNNGLRLFVQLREGTDVDAFNAKILNVVNDHTEGARSDIFLQSVEDMYLYGTFRNGELAGGRIEYVRIFGLVAVFLLLIAGINFMNLATARSAKRAREIGVRKAVGATQGSLARQFLGESVLVALVAFVVAAGVVVAGLPAFNALTGKAVTWGGVAGGTWLLFLGIAVGTGLLAGSYPALYLASFNTIGVLRGSVIRRRGSVGLRKGLVLFQFALSILLIISTLTVYRQVEYIQTKNLGLDRENLLSLPLEGAAKEQYAAFKQELIRQPGIAGVTASAQNPLSVGSSTPGVQWDGKDPEDRTLFHILSVDHDFVETMHMELAGGRSFSEALATDSMNVLINETAAEAMGMTDPLGQRVALWEREGEVIGVVKDFHMTSLHDAIEPTVLRLEPRDASFLYVRTEAGHTQEALAGLEATLKRFNPEAPFDYEFVDTLYEQMYESEMRIGALANVFAGLAIFIACLGLFGLAAYAAEQRTKEVGIRKVMGASVGSLMLLLSRDFVKLVLGAFVVTAPVAYFVMEAWLNDYTYRVEQGVWVFVLAGLAAVVIAWLTVGYQAFRAATVNPVRSLRTE